jgi:thiol-disulfide isomerase/thioredoxin
MRIALAVVAALCLIAGRASAAPPKEGEVAPPFTLTLVDGRQVSLEDLRGKVVVLNFWATWCAPCKRELPLLDNYYDLMEKHGLRVFAITSSDSIPIGKLKKLFDAMAIPSVRNIKGRYTTLGGLPTNYVIDRSGTVRYAKAGAFDLDALNALLIPLLNEPVPAIQPAPAAP